MYGNVNNTLVNTSFSSNVFSCADTNCSSDFPGGRSLRQWQIEVHISAYLCIFACLTTTITEQRKKVANVSNKCLVLACLNLGRQNTTLVASWVIQASFLAIVWSCVAISGPSKTGPFATLCSGCKPFVCVLANDQVYHADPTILFCGN